MTPAWELISTEPRGQVGRRQIVAKTFRLPDGTEAVFEITGDASHRVVACVALTTTGTVLLAEQYRPGPERLMMDLPGGGVEPGEALAEAAARELSEETGFAARQLTYLGEMHYDAYTGYPRHYFLAAGCERHGDQHLDDGEFVSVREVQPAELVRLALAARLTDPGGVLLALPYLAAADPGVAALLAARPLP